MTGSPLHYVFDLLTELRRRIPPQEGMRHNITLTYDGRLELTTFAADYPHQVFWLTPDDDGHLASDEIVDYIEATLTNLKKAN